MIRSPGSVHQVDSSATNGQVFHFWAVEKPVKLAYSLNILIAFCVYRTSQILKVGDKLRFVFFSGNILPDGPIAFTKVRWLQWPDFVMDLDWRTLQYLVYVDLRNSSVKHLNGIEVRSRNMQYWLFLASRVSCEMVFWLISTTLACRSAKI